MVGMASLKPIETWTILHVQKQAGQPNRWREKIGDIAAPTCMRTALLKPIESWTILLGVRTDEGYVAVVCGGGKYQLVDF
jgi:hypothetical protein